MGAFDAAVGVNTGRDQCIASTASVKMSKKFIFSSVEDEILIDSVQKNKVLYDCSHPKNKDIFFKDTLWKSLSEELNRTGK